MILDQFGHPIRRPRQTPFPVPDWLVQHAVDSVTASLTMMQTVSDVALAPAREGRGPVLDLTGRPASPQRVHIRFSGRYLP